MNTFKNTGIIHIDIKYGSLDITVTTAGDIEKLVYTLQRTDPFNGDDENFDQVNMQDAIQTKDINSQPITNSTNLSWDISFEFNEDLFIAPTFDLWVHSYTTEGYVETWHLHVRVNTIAQTTTIVSQTVSGGSSNNSETSDSEQGQEDTSDTSDSSDESDTSEEPSGSDDSENLSGSFGVTIVSESPIGLLSNMELLMGPETYTFFGQDVEYGENEFYLYCVSTGNNLFTDAAGGILNMIGTGVDPFESAALGNQPAISFGFDLSQFALGHTYSFELEVYQAVGQSLLGTIQGTIDLNAPEEASEEEAPIGTIEEFEFSLLSLDWPSKYTAVIYTIQTLPQEFTIGFYGRTVPEDLIWNVEIHEKVTGTYPNWDSSNLVASHTESSTIYQSAPGYLNCSSFGLFHIKAYAEDAYGNVIHHSDLYEVLLRAKEYQQTGIAIAQQAYIQSFDVDDNGEIITDTTYMGWNDQWRVPTEIAEDPDFLAHASFTDIQSSPTSLGRHLCYYLVEESELISVDYYFSFIFTDYIAYYTIENVSTGTLQYYSAHQCQQHLTIFNDISIRVTTYLANHQAVKSYLIPLSGPHNPSITTIRDVDGMAYFSVDVDADGADFVTVNIFELELQSQNIYSQTVRFSLGSLPATAFPQQFEYSPFGTNLNSTKIATTALVTITTQDAQGNALNEASRYVGICQVNHSPYTVCTPFLAYLDPNIPQNQQPEWPWLANIDFVQGPNSKMEALFTDISEYTHISSMLGYPGFYVHEEQQGQNNSGSPIYMYYVMIQWGVMPLTAIVGKYSVMVEILEVGTNNILETYTDLFVLDSLDPSDIVVDNELNPNEDGVGNLTFQWTAEIDRDLRFSYLQDGIVIDTKTITAVSGNPTYSAEPTTDGNDPNVSLSFALQNGLYQSDAHLESKQVTIQATSNTPVVQVTITDTDSGVYPATDLSELSSLLQSWASQQNLTLEDIHAMFIDAVVTGIASAGPTIPAEYSYDFEAGAYPDSTANSGKGILRTDVIYRIDVVALDVNGVPYDPSVYPDSSYTEFLNTAGDGIISDDDYFNSPLNLPQNYGTPFACALVFQDKRNHAIQGTITQLVKVRDVEQAPPWDPNNNDPNVAITVKEFYRDDAAAIGPGNNGWDQTTMNYPASYPLGVILCLVPVVNTPLMRFKVECIEQPVLDLQGPMSILFEWMLDLYSATKTWKVTSDQFNMIHHFCNLLNNDGHEIHIWPSSLHYVNSGGELLDYTPWGVRQDGFDGPAWFLQNNAYSNTAEYDLDDIITKIEAEIAKPFRGLSTPTEMYFEPVTEPSNSWPLAHELPSALPPASDPFWDDESWKTAYSPLYSFGFFEEISFTIGSNNTGNYHDLDQNTRFVNDVIYKYTVYGYDEDGTEIVSDSVFFRVYKEGVYPWHQNGTWGNHLADFLPY